MRNFGCLLFARANWLVHSLHKWYAKLRTGKIPSRNRVCHLNKSIPLIGKRARKSEKYWYQTGLWRNMEHGFPFGTFHQEKQDCLFRSFLAPGNFPLKRPEKSSVPFILKQNFSETFCKWLTTQGHQPTSYSPYFPQFWSEINGSFRNWPLDRYVAEIVAHYGVHWWRSVKIGPPFVSIK